MTLSLKGLTMQIELVKEHADGSATVSLDMTNEEVKTLLNWAFIELLKKGIEEGKEYEPQENEGEQSISHLGNTEY
jgi:hypothetical protein